MRVNTIKIAQECSGLSLDLLKIRNSRVGEGVPIICLTLQVILMYINI